MTRTEEQRAQLLEQYQASGQSIVEFCRLQGIEPSYMYSLTRRQRDRKTFVRVGAEPNVTIRLMTPPVQLEVKLSDLAQVLRHLGASQ